MDERTATTDDYPPLNVEAELAAIAQSVSHLRGVIVTGEGMLPQTRQVIDNLHERIDRLRAENDATPTDGNP